MPKWFYGRKAPCCLPPPGKLRLNLLRLWDNRTFGLCDRDGSLKNILYSLVLYLPVPFLFFSPFCLFACMIVYSFVLYCFVLGGWGGWAVVVAVVLFSLSLSLLIIKTDNIDKAQFDVGDILLALELNRLSRKETARAEKRSYRLWNFLGFNLWLRHCGRTKMYFLHEY